jgi:hypothetical protein
MDHQFDEDFPLCTIPLIRRPTLLLDHQFDEERGQLAIPISHFRGVWLSLADTFTLISGDVGAANG